MSGPRRRQLDRGWRLTGLTLALAVLAVVVANAAYVRLDLTSDGRFSLSEVAKATIRGLDHPLEAHVYFSEGLEAPYHDHRRALLDTLTELGAHAPHGLDVAVTDPSGDPDAVAEATEQGIRPLPYAFRQWDRTEARTVWMGVVFTYEGRQVAVDALVSVPEMEAELVRAIRRVRAPAQDVRRVGWRLGAGAPDPRQLPDDNPLAGLWRDLQEDGAARVVAPGEEPIPADLDALLVVAPTEPLSEGAVYALDQYLMGGGAVALWLSGVRPDFAADRPVAVRHGLGSWLERLGVAVGAEVLLDRDHAEQMVVPMDLEGRGRSLVQLTYPLALVTTRLDRRVRAVRDVPRLVVPFATPVRLGPPGARAVEVTVEATVWAETMPEAVAVPDLRTLDPKGVRQPLPGEVAGPHPLVVALAGQFSSGFSEPATPGWGAAHEDRSRPTRLLVVGSGDALANNRSFARNTVDWLVDDPAMIGIRGRGGVAPLVPPPSGEALRAKLLVVGLPLVALALAGVAMARRRPRAS